MFPLGFPLPPHRHAGSAFGSPAAVCGTPSGHTSVTGGSSMDALVPFFARSHQWFREGVEIPLCSRSKKWRAKMRVQGKATHAICARGLVITSNHRLPHGHSYQNNIKDVRRLAIQAPPPKCRCFIKIHKAKWLINDQCVALCSIRHRQ